MNPFHYGPGEKGGQFAPKDKDGSATNDNIKVDLKNMFEDVDEDLKNFGFSFVDLETDEDLINMAFESDGYYEEVKSLQEMFELQREQAKRCPITKSEVEQIWSHGWGQGYIRTGNSMKINSILRNDEILNRDDKKTVQTLDDVISRSTLSKNLQGYKMNGQSWTANFFGDILKKAGFEIEERENGRFKVYDQNGNHVNSNSFRKKLTDTLKKANIIGTMLEPEKGFSSFSLVEKENVFEDRPIKMSFELPKGLNCYITRNFDESEAILGRNTQFYIKDVRYVESRGGRIGTTEIVFGIVSRRK